MGLPHQPSGGTAAALKRSETGNRLRECTGVSHEVLRDFVLPRQDHTGTHPPDPLSRKAIEGEPIAAAILASGRYALRLTKRYSEPRGVFCAIGRCTDCLMEVNGKPNVRSCVTAAEPGMKIRTLKGLKP